MNNSSPALSNHTSPRLRKLYKERLEVWKRSNGAGVEQLAQRCGVSASYLGQIARYGRVPGKPVLLLLAFNLDRNNPERWFSAADMELEWPYEPGVGLTKIERENDGFLSIKVDMSRFEDTIESVLTKTLRSRSIKELSRGKPLKVGVDLGAVWGFQQMLQGAPSTESGFFPELLRTISISLQTKFSIEPCKHWEFVERLERAEIDLFGPMFALPGRLRDSMLAVPFCSVGLSAVWRKGTHPRLEKLPKPKKLEELRSADYVIAVIKSGISNHFANTRLSREKNLLHCETHEEREERLLLDGMARPAHLILCDSIVAKTLTQRHPQRCELLFESEPVLDSYQHCIAVRRDWPELRTLIADSIKFLQKSSSLQDMFWNFMPRDLEGFVSFSMDES